MTVRTTIFLDAMLLRFAVAEEPATYKKTLRWGPNNETLDIATTVPRTRREDWLQYEIDCLPKIADLVRLDQIEACINMELRLEVACLKYGGLVNSELSLFHGIRFRIINDPFPYGRIVASAHHSIDQLDGFREDIFNVNFDQRFNELKKAVGGNKNPDAFHILSAERAGLDFFVTTDKLLINSLRNQRKVLPSVKVVYPSEFLAQICRWPANPDLHTEKCPSSL